MKTHEVAKVLSELANTLRRMPNQPIEELGFGHLRTSVDQASVPVALRTLVALSSIDKAQWLELIKEHNFPIQHRPRDASRDIMGKLLRYLEQNRDARERLSQTVTKSRSETTTSPELLRAFRVLLDEK
jgi:hypothetical protein